MDRIQWHFYSHLNKEILVFLPENENKFLNYDQANNILKASRGETAFPWTVSQASPGSDLLL